MRQSRLVWDLRKTNLRWRDPPWILLGSPISLSCLDLVDDVLEGRAFSTCQGDLTDFFYTLELPAQFILWFVFRGAGSDDLIKHAAGLGRALDIPVGKKLGLKVQGIGWSWAVFLSHSCLQSIFDAGIADIEKGSQLIDGCPTPQLDCFSQVFWLHIDDFAVAQLEESETGREAPGAVATLQACRERIVATGLRVHKERAGLALPSSLGVEINEALELRALTEKQAVIASATSELVRRGRCSSKDIEVLLGSWVWMMMPCWQALSVCVEVYTFVHRFAGEGPRFMPLEVSRELSTLVSLLPLLKVELDAKWHERAYMVDASLGGFGAVASRASVAELREEARWCERRGWAVQLEKEYSDLEKVCFRDPAAELGIGGCVKEVREPRTGRLFLELFSGHGVLSCSCRELLGCATEAWDKLNGAEFDLGSPEVVAGLIHRIRAKEFFFVHLAPPYGTFSRARSPPLRSWHHLWGLPDLSPEKKHRVDEGSYLCLLSIEVCRECHKSGTYFSLENPESSMMWSFPPMEGLLSDLGLEVIWLDYCMFEAPWKKPTRFVTSFEGLLCLRRRCVHQGWHQPLRGIAPSGRLWTQEACAYPCQLCDQFALCLAPLLEPPS